MWQRIQTVYLVLAVIACAVCLCLPVADIVPQQMAANDTAFNLWMQKADGTIEYPDCNIVGFILLCAVCSEGVITIFQYKNRKKQVDFCTGAIAMTLLWIVGFILYSFAGLSGIDGEVQPRFAACLPLLAMILFILARKAILKDEALVKAADRIR